MGLSCSFFLLMKPIRSVGEKKAIEREIVKLWDELAGEVVHDGLGSITMESWIFQMLVQKL